MGTKRKQNTKDTKEGADTMNATIQRPCSISESLVQSCKEVQLIREGKLPKKTWKELKEELKNLKNEESK
jgi:hypothetical protein